MQTEKKSITIRNDSETVLSCLWYVLEVIDETSMQPIVRSKGPWTTKKPSNIFTVSPRHAEIPPQETVTFDVTFTPAKENQYYTESLDLSISQYYEGNCLPSPCLVSIQVSGNSFTSNAEEFPSNVYFFPSKVSFPPVLHGCQVYQTVALRNQGCTPLW